jgi:tetratricopeptide (TPR) repeat protein
MKIKGILLCLGACGFLTVSVVNADEKSCNELIQESEQMWLENKYDESDGLLDEAMNFCPKQSDPYWRKARNEFDRLETIPRDKKPEKDILMERYLALQALADKCIELDENNGSCWFWKGVGIGRYGTTRGVLRSLFLADDVEGAWLKAESLKPRYRSKDGRSNAMGDCYNALGMFYRLVPEWLCYFPFNWLIGACGDKAKAIAYHRKAVAIAPKRIQYQRGLAVSLLCHGQTYDKPEEIEEGKKILKELQSLPEIRPYDKLDKAHARMLLQDPSLACGYQRDAQHEVSQEAYDNNKKD